MQQISGASSPVRLEIDYPEQSSRLLALCGILMPIKVLLLLPVLIIMQIFGAAASMLMFVGLFAVLFTGRYPRFFDFFVRFFRWQMHVSAYLLSLTDKYPPFFPELH